MLEQDPPTPHGGSGEQDSVACAGSHEGGLWALTGKQAPNTEEQSHGRQAARESCSVGSGSCSGRGRLDSQGLRWAGPFGLELGLGRGRRHTSTNDSGSRHVGPGNWMRLLLANASIDEGCAGGQVTSNGGGYCGAMDEKVFVIRTAVPGRIVSRRISVRVGPFWTTPWGRVQRPGRGCSDAW